MRKKVVIALSGFAVAPARVVAQHGRVATDTVRAAALKNRLGDPAQSAVSVYLPPSYDTAPGKRYPVLYLLHDASNTDRSWLANRPGSQGIPQIMDSLVAANAIQEMIVVMPNASNRFGATWYLNSATTGQWTDFIARDLVAWTDSHFRTLARPESRGLAGVSMGGLGTFVVAMHYGETYSAIYAASPCCTDRLKVFDPQRDVENWRVAAAIPSFDSLARAPGLRTGVSLATAYIPDSSRPPFYFAFPFTRNGDAWVASPSVLAQWDANVPVRMLASRAATLRRIHAIQMDHGRQDPVVPVAEAMVMDSALTRANVPHVFEVYDGGHFDRGAERLSTRILPFFSRSLARQQPGSG